MNDKNRSLMIFSPILVVGLGFLTATIAVRLINEWAWVPLAIIYWSTMAFIIYRHKRTTFTSWLQKPKGHKGWIILAFSVSLLPLPAFIFGWHTLDSGLIISLWILTFLINPPLEEGYWRGVMMEITQHWPAWLSILYTSVFFTASHPLMWGVFSIANQSPVTWTAVFLMGLAWGTYFYKTKSLRWVIVAHILVDILNLCVPVFLNKFTGM